MELLAAYGDSGDDEEKPPTPKLPARKMTLCVNTAPDVDLTRQMSEKAAKLHMPELLANSTAVLSYNPSYDVLTAPEQGPSINAHKSVNGGVTIASKGVNWKGHLEDAGISSFNFEEQFNTFNAYGFAADPGLSQGSGNPAGIVGDLDKWAEAGGGTISTIKKGLQSKDEELRKRLRLDDEPDQEIELTVDQKEKIESMLSKNKRKRERWGRDEEDATPMEEKSIYHGGTEMYDYQGRTFVDAPTDLKNVEHECFIPKKWMHTWSGHTKGVAKIGFFPKTGHLLMSVGLDSKVKIWDVMTHKKCMRTYLGHAAAVRDFCFSNDGRRFLTCGYDRYIKLWDTETGECITSFTNRKLPYCCKFNPGMENIVMTGCSNKHIVQYDINTGSVQQVYDHHLAAVNTINFVDNNRRFVTSADDKKILVWEFGIPVPIKHISEPHMHSIPFISISPNEKWMVGQSLDNQVVTYGANDRFRINRKKVFKGHLCAGYACQVGFSPDGQFVYSGDADGKVWFWDWKSCKNYRKLKCHEGVCIGAIWHPIEPSKMATCGWDGTIKYWD